jgi:hypothetical protein
MTGWNRLLLIAGAAFIFLSTTALASDQDESRAIRRCQEDRPCFTDSRQIGNKIVFQFNGTPAWDFYNLRYVTPRGEKQVENRSGSFTLNNVAPFRVYRLRVQGCNADASGRPACSPWVVESVATR